MSAPVARLAKALAVIDGQAALLGDCRKALDALLAKRPILGALNYGTTTLGNLRAELYEYRAGAAHGVDDKGEPR